MEYKWKGFSVEITGTFQPIFGNPGAFRPDSFALNTDFHRPYARFSSQVLLRGFR